MKRWIWLAERKIQYLPLMIYHKIIKSDSNRTVKQVVGHQINGNFQNRFYQKVKKSTAEILTRKKEVKVLK